MTIRLDAKRRRSLARHLLLAMGASGVAFAGCASEVIVERNGNGAGGSGGASTSGQSSSSSSASSSSSGGFNCVAPQPLQYICIGANGSGQCPVGQQLYAELAAELGPCTPMDPDFCWCDYSVDSVPCGPDPVMPQGECCYYASVFSEELCEGRPFVVEGHARVAPSCARADWMGDGATPDVEDLDAATRQALAEAWCHDALAEHASVASFARFVLQLLAVGAPSSMVRAAQQAMADEIRHAELCFALAARYGAEPCGPGELPVDGSLDPCDLASLAVAAFHDGCVNETLSALTALAARDRASDAAVRAALGEIARDEMAHAELAWRFVAWAVQRDASARAAVARAVGEVSQFTSKELDGRADSDALRAHGRIGGHEHATILRASMYEVVMPSAQVILGVRPPAFGATA
jgi:hypothetical protein